MYTYLHAPHRTAHTEEAMPVKHQNVALDYIGKRGSAINVGRRERVQYAREILQKEVWRHWIVHRILSYDIVVIIIKYCDKKCLYLFVIWFLGGFLPSCILSFSSSSITHHTHFTTPHSHTTLIPLTAPHHTTHIHFTTHTNHIHTPHTLDRYSLTSEQKRIARPRKLFSWVTLCIKCSCVRWED